MFILCANSEEAVLNCYGTGDYMLVLAAGWLMVGCGVGLLLAPCYLYEERVEKL